MFANLVYPILGSVQWALARRMAAYVSARSLATSLLVKFAGSSMHLCCSTSTCCYRVAASKWCIVGERKCCWQSLIVQSLWTNWTSNSARWRR